ncbi:MAG: hypothetical protein ABI632_00575 [Pseudolysinimonas sp.]
MTGDYVYAIFLCRPSDGVARIRSWGAASGLLERGIRSVTALGDLDPVQWKLAQDSLEVTLHETHADQIGVVVKIFLEPDSRPERVDFLHG